VFFRHSNNPTRANREPTDPSTQETKPASTGSSNRQRGNKKPKTKRSASWPASKPTSASARPKTKMYFSQCSTRLGLWWEMDCLHAGRYLSDRPRTPLWADGECTDPCVITWRQRSITVRRHQLHHILQVSEKLQTPPSASLWITAERSHYPRMACSCAHAFSRD
jgi:hypothetical protein